MRGDTILEFGKLTFRKVKNTRNRSRNGPRGPRGGKRARIIRRLTERHGLNCHWCSLPLNKDITIEHLTRLADGGTNQQENLRLAHARCNHDRHT